MKSQATWFSPNKSKFINEMLVLHTLFNHKPYKLKNLKNLHNLNILNNLKNLKNLIRATRTAITMWWLRTTWPQVPHTPRPSRWLATTTPWNIFGIATTTNHAIGDDLRYTFLLGKRKNAKGEKETNVSMTPYQICSWRFAKWWKASKVRESWFPYPFC